jgi:sigma-B regulation protein RsbU (phosphoserine phosphatase)
MFEEAAWQQAQIVLPPGDLLVLYTDGVTEAENGDGAAWGDAALRSLVQTQAAQSAAAVRAAILDAVHQFCGNAAQTDDITLMVVRREP